MRVTQGLEQAQFLAGQHQLRDVGAEVHRVFNHDYDQTAAGLIDPDVLEQTGLDQGLQAVIDMRLVETPAGARLEIGTDGRHFDAAITFDLDGIQGLGSRRRRNNQSRQRGSNRHGDHDQGGQQAPPHSHSNIHAQRALVIPIPARTPTTR